MGGRPGPLANDLHKGLLAARRTIPREPEPIAGQCVPSTFCRKQHGAIVADVSRDRPRELPCGDCFVVAMPLGLGGGKLQYHLITLDDHMTSDSQGCEIAEAHRMRTEKGHDQAIAIALRASEFRES